MPMQGVYLVFGPRTRVVTVQAKGGVVTRGTVAQHVATGEHLRGVIGHHEGGLAPAQADRILRKRVEITGLGVSAPVDLGLLFDPNSNMVAMAGEVTVGQMKQFVEATRYQPIGHGIASFNNLLSAGADSDIMVFTKEADCLAFAAWALPKAQAQDPRIQTLGLPSDREWLRMRAAFRGQQAGQYWERLSDGGFRSFHNEDRNNYNNRENRYNNNAFRLVEDIKLPASAFLRKRGECNIKSRAYP